MINQCVEDLGRRCVDAECWEPIFLYYCKLDIVLSLQQSQIHIQVLAWKRQTPLIYWVLSLLLNFRIGVCEMHLGIFCNVYLSSILSDIERREILWISHWETDHVHEVGAHMHHCRDKHTHTTSETHTNTLGMTA